MLYLRRSRYSPSCSPYQRGRSLPRSLSRSRSRSRSRDSSDVENPGNNLYVTGLSSTIRKADLEDHFSCEGKVTDVHLVLGPWTREPRGFGFVTMATLEDANRCIKYLDGSLLEGRVITVEKARRRCGRTPTPGRYLGPRTGNGVDIVIQAIRWETTGHTLLTIGDTDLGHALHTTIGDVNPDHTPHTTVGGGDTIVNHPLEGDTDLTPVT